MEPESSLPYSQAPATCPYPEPTPSSPHNPFPLPQDHICLHDKSVEAKYQRFASFKSVMMGLNSLPKMQPDYRLLYVSENPGKLSTFVVSLRPS